MRLLSYNIRYGGAGREDRLAAAIRESGAHLVVLQEATKPAAVERIAKAAGMNFWASRVGDSLAFISRDEIAHYEWHSVPGAKRAFLEIVPAASEVRVFGLHLRAIHSNWTERRRVRELRALLESIEHHQKDFHVLLGDFNTLAPGERLVTRDLPLRLRPFVWLGGGYIRWQTVQIMLDAGYVDGYRLVHPLERGFTFPAWNPHVRLDYIFVPAAFAHRLKGCQVRNEGSAVVHASDHFPLLAELDIS